jgi:hypothetical protein
MKKRDLNYKYIDDVMIGSILQDQQITPIPRYDISNEMPLNFNAKCFHVRLKSSRRDIDASRLLQLNSFKRLTDFMESINNNGGKIT